MNCYRFDAGVGRKIDHFGSTNLILSLIARVNGTARISCFHLGLDGTVGYHQASTQQLLLVVEGEGWARGGAGDRVPIAPGCAVCWERGEWHELHTQAGLTAIVIESETAQPGTLLLEAIQTDSCESR